MTINSETFESFSTNPWGTHPSYKNSILSFSNSPEYAAPEVLLASLYRRIGLRRYDAGSEMDIPEGDVGKNGTQLAKVIDKHRKSGKQLGLLGVEGWGRVVDEVIRSPKQPNQRTRSAIQLTPIIPSCAAFSMAARLRGNPWNPGAYIESCVSLGEGSREKALATWKELFKCLTVSDEDDDVWAVFLEKEIQRWSPIDLKWEFRGIKDTPTWMEEWRDPKADYPAARFVTDLNHVLEAKHFLTRRQWTSVLESCLRIGLGSHTLWVSKCNRELFRICDDVLRGGEVPSATEIRSRLSTGEGFWSYEQPVGGQIKKLIREYIYGRIGLNLILYRSVEIEALRELATSLPFRSPERIRTFLLALSGSLADFDYPKFVSAFDQALETEPRKVSAKQGIGKNMEEFLRHSLGQRETHERGLESYDQGYLFGRRGSYSRAPWILSCGPVMTLTLTYCCSRDGTGVRTVKDLCNHLGEYGIRISPDEVSKSRLGLSLRTLGLVLDSPDAEGGMVIINPFGSGQKQAKQVG
ncbi:MAG: hypothetical protein SynsKO_42770 [Synoicihabitans sp.]